MVFSDCSSAQTSPKPPDPVSLISPAGALPDTATVAAGVSGSLLAIVMVAFCPPRLVGANLTGTAWEFPGVITDVKLEGIWKLELDDDILVMLRLQSPLLLIVRLRSLNSPTQTLPKSPLFAIEVVISGSVPFPVAATAIDGLPISLLLTVSSAVCVDVPVGVNFISNG
jgi:hypothetical protein